MASAPVYSYNNATTPQVPVNGTAAMYMTDELRIYDIVKQIYIYYVPLIITIGLFGNTMSISVLFTTNLKTLSSSYYLSSLAASDSLFLIQLMFQWLSTIGYQGIHIDGVCQIITYVGYLSGFLSPWLVVAFTVERYIAVCHPLKRPSMCTVGRAKWVIGAVTLGAGAYHSWVLVVFDVFGIYPQCQIKEEYMDFTSILNHIDTISTLVIPVVVIGFMNITIAIKVYQFYRNEALREGQESWGCRHNCNQQSNVATTALLSNAQRIQGSGVLANGNLHQFTAPSPLISPAHEHLQQVKTDSGATGQGLRRLFVGRQYTDVSNSPNTGAEHGGGHMHCKHNRGSMRNKMQINITKMLLIVSTVFVCLNLPAHITRMYIWVLLQRDQAYLIGYKIMAVLSIFNLLFYTNFGINFFLYMVSGANFRKALKGMVSTCWCRLKWRSLLLCPDDEYSNYGYSPPISLQRKRQSLPVDAQIHKATSPLQTEEEPSSESPRGTPLRGRARASSTPPNLYQYACGNSSNKPGIGSNNTTN